MVGSGTKTSPSASGSGQSLWGTEGPWNIGKFYGTSYFVNPRGQFVAEASEDNDELVVADLDLSIIDEVRNTWQFYRDRRPDAYDEIHGK